MFSDHDKKVRHGDKPADGPFCFRSRAEFFGSLPTFFGSRAKFIACLILVLYVDGDLSLECLFEGDDRLCARQSQRLQFVVDDTEQMLVVLGVYLDEQVILPRRIVAFHYLGYLLQRFGDAGELSRRVKEKTNIGACLVAYFRVVNDKLGTFDHAEIGQFLYALVDGSSRYVTLSRYLKKRHAGVSDN